jgi:hypothetical protein
MNKRQILASLNKIADQLDNNNLFKEANTITNVMIKVADEFDMGDKPNLPNFPDEEDEREDCCPNCGNCEERLASDPSVIIMGRFSNGVVAWCENNNCSYDYWEDAKEGVKDPICPICNQRELYFENERDPYQHMTCGNTECNAVFIEGEEAKK